MVFEGLVFAAGVLVQVLRWMTLYYSDQKKIMVSLCWIIPSLLCTAGGLLLWEYLAGEAFFEIWYHLTTWFAVAMIFFAMFVAFGTSRLLLKLDTTGGVSMVLLGCFYLWHVGWIAPLWAGGTVLAALIGYGIPKLRHWLGYVLYTLVIAGLCASGWWMFTPLATQYGPIPLWQLGLLGGLFLFVAVHSFFLARWIAMLTALLRPYHRKALGVWMEEHVRSDLPRWGYLLVTIGTIGGLMGTVWYGPLTIFQEAELLLAGGLLLNDRLYNRE